MKNREKYPLFMLIILAVVCLGLSLIHGAKKADIEIPMEEEADGNEVGPFSESEEDQVALPEFSKDSGFYKKGFKLSIKVPEGTKVYYTLDSSKPTKKSKKYKKSISIKDNSSEPAIHSMRTDFEPYTPVNVTGFNSKVAPGWFSRNVLPDKVDKCQVVRAVAIDKEGNRSKVVTASYFIGYQKKEGYDDLAVMSLVSDPEDLFDDDRGIMVNGSLYKEKWARGDYNGILDSHKVRGSCNTYRGRGKEWEREVHLDFFGEDRRDLIFSQEAGIRLHGNQSRVAEPQKSFNLYARRDYDGNSTFIVPFFNDGLLQDKVTLMRGGDLRNYYLNEKMDNRAMDTQQYRMVQVFLDGEYWGLYALQEKYNSKEYVKTHYNLDKGDYTLVKGLPTGFDIKDGDPDAIKTSFRLVRDYARDKDLSLDENYQELCEMMDMQSFIDAYAVRLYTGDQDWSWFKNQYMLFFDQKWHWMVFDIDYGAGKRQGADVNTFLTPRVNVNYSLENDALFPYLMKNKDFRRQFVNTFMDMGNEVFKGSKVRKELGAFAKKYKEAGIIQTLRYPPIEEFKLYKYDPTYISEINKLCDDIPTYFEGRQDYAFSYLADYFSLSGDPVKITLKNEESEGGTISINTVTPDLNKDGMWTGTYYTDYPVTLTAKPEKGWAFAGWKTDKGKLEQIDDTSYELSFKGNVKAKAVFKKAEESDDDTQD